MKRIAIIGCGAAGMMAALAAANSSVSVTIFEKNEKPGKKIYITGKGRCNVTNACDQTDFFDHVKRNPRFLYSAFYDYDNTAVMDFFESNGCRLKIERGDRVFPVSDHSSDIIRTLFNAVKKAGVKVLFDTEVLSVETSGQSVSAITYADKAGSSKKGGDAPIMREEFDSVIVCTGGVSYPSTGSTGDGYEFAKAAGHSVKEPRPSLVPFETKEDWCRELQGLSLKNVGLKLFLSNKDGAEDNSKSAKKKKPVYEGFGEMLFTHFGVSGPLVLTASCHYEKDKKAELLLDLKPALSEKQLDTRVLRDFDEGLNKQFKNVIGGLFPSKLVPVMIRLSGIDPERPVHDITKEERLSFVRLIKNLPITVNGTRSFNEAIITRGGVDVKEINPSTMESKLIKGLYFAGEVIDVDTETGGFNLQVAWSTGHLAGTSAGEI
ncbi:NAD(P)/FAD-dependent oxidoreductase [Butyrivibrio sp. XB500-5]|uniref:NAD(P)/FAD-dependent oxidoreductase n=1 Tax=Butyrivibrio sp. XB500-5 TaxID=2364880 RepID=UPI000EA9C75D|nr:NAD(P)/FAD-dependent oxidoreductase [Butyrivibrio sp. XB500-5]RKM63233.1 NAD(P)/FAD-dependent oxidoreductase [Butyrivibrio sp. XB500-5]